MTVSSILRPGCGGLLIAMLLPPASGSRSVGGIAIFEAEDHPQLRKLKCVPTAGEAGSRAGRGPMACGHRQSSATRSAKSGPDRWLVHLPAGASTIRPRCRRLGPEQPLDAAFDPFGELSLGLKRLSESSSPRSVTPPGGCAYVRVEIPQAFTHTRHPLDDVDVDNARALLGEQFARRHLDINVHVLRRDFLCVMPIMKRRSYIRRSTGLGTIPKRESTGPSKPPADGTGA